MNKDIYKKILKDKDVIGSYLKTGTDIETLSTGVVSMNLLYSGRVDGGIPIGKVSQMAAPSTLGKSFIGLACLKNAQKKGFTCIVVDTEFAFDFDFAEAIGIDISKDKLIVIQNNRIEEVQKMVLGIFDGMETLQERNNIFVLLDSFGGLVTSKTEGDAKDGKDVMDMTEAKKKNKFAKLLMGTRGTFFIVNHVYDNIGGFGDPLSIPGGRGLYFASHCIVLGSSKAKDKDAGEISGALITCKTQKSRLSKEHSKIKFRIKHEGGLDIWYGLLDDAMESGVVISPSKGFISRTHIKDDKKLREKNIYTKDFWIPIFKETNFKEFLENKYTFKGTSLDIAEDDVIGEL